MATEFILHKCGNRERELAQAAEFLARLPREKGWKVEVSQYVKKRTNLQNDYLWSVAYKILGDHIGCTLEEAHEFMLGEHFGWERIDMLGRTKLRPRRRSSKLSTIEFAGYVDAIQRRAAEHGIYIPDPDPQWRERVDKEMQDQARAAA